jgi:hypothetical protein
MLKMRAKTLVIPRRQQFAELTEDEVARIEAIYAEAFSA